MIRKLILIRHGMTAGNREKRYIGMTDEKLCPIGREALNQEKKRGLYPAADLLFSSPLVRCLETAAILYPGQEPLIIEAFRECSFDQFEGKNYKELSDNPLYQAWIDSGGALPFPGGESMESFRERCARGLGQLLARFEEEEKPQTTACIVHGGTIMALLSRFGTEGKDYYDYQCGNGQGYCCLVEKNGKGEIRLSWIQPLQYSQDLF